MSLMDCIERAERAEEHAYAQRAVVGKKAQCPVCQSRGHVYQNEWFLGGKWWCARCNHEFTE